MFGCLLRHGKRKLELSLNDTTFELNGSGSQLFLSEQIIQRILPVRRTCRHFLHREFLFYVVAIKAPRCSGVAESAPDVFADAAVLQRAAGVELNLQDACSRVVADGAQFAGVDLFHFHGIRRFCKSEVVDADVMSRFLLFVFDGGDGQPERMEDAPLFGFAAYLATPGTRQQ